MKSHKPGAEADHVSPSHIANRQCSQTSQPRSSSNPTANPTTPPFRRSASRAQISRTETWEWNDVLFCCRVGGRFTAGVREVGLGVCWLDGRWGRGYRLLRLGVRYRSKVYDAWRRLGLFWLRGYAECVLVFIYGVGFSVFR